jgi:hypothetical protein
MEAEARIKKGHKDFEISCVSVKGGNETRKVGRGEILGTLLLFAREFGHNLQGNEWGTKEWFSGVYSHELLTRMMQSSGRTLFLPEQSFWKKVKTLSSGTIHLTLKHGVTAWISQICFTFLSYKEN